jgi:hypothetical protein
MNNTNTGGPVFPAPTTKPLENYYPGISVRDYFAAKAMQGYISAKAWHPDFIYPEDFNFDAGQRAADAIAVASYKWADAMLKARET